MNETGSADAEDDKSAVMKGIIILLACSGKYWF
jgi:hypothetical protein